MTSAERPSYICLKFGPHCVPHLWTRDKIVTDNKSSEKLTWVFVSYSKINEKDRQKKKKKLEDYQRLITKIFIQDDCCIKVLW